MFEERFRKRLLMQQRAGLYRNPPDLAEREGKYLRIGNKKVLNFSSNDYLGLAVSRELREKVAAAFQKYGTSSSSSRLVSGHYSIITHAEKIYAGYFGYEDALFFPSGYQANVGVISTLFDKGDVVVFDKHIHASSVKGMALSKAEFLGYRHNSMSHLEKRLEARKNHSFGLLTESLFSMDGDILDCQGIERLKTRYGFLTIVDEAHAFGVLGEGGRGIAGRVADVAVGTFGKALGLFGAFVLLPKGFKEYLFNFCSPLIYSTTLPEAHAASALAVLDFVSQGDHVREVLRKNTSHMRKSLQSEGFKVSGDAHVLGVEMGDETTAAATARKLFDRDMFVLAARYPTVPIGKAILRIGMTALHTADDVAKFVDALKNVGNELGFLPDGNPGAEHV